MNTSEVEMIKDKRAYIESLDHTIGTGRTIQEDEEMDVDNDQEDDANDEELEEEGGG